MALIPSGTHLSLPLGAPSCQRRRLAGRAPVSSPRSPVLSENKFWGNDFSGILQGQHRHGVCAARGTTEQTTR